MTSLLIHNIQIAMPDGRLMDGEIIVENGRIATVSDVAIEGFSGTRMDGQGCIALPGFIDIHIHGADGADFMDGDNDSFERIASALPKEGTTSYLATPLTQSEVDIAKAVDAGSRFMEQNETGAEMLGFHLEGPFIHPEQAGAQPVRFIQKPSFALLERWFGKELGHLKVVTLAPERDEGLDMTRRLTDRGIIVSAGHTKASFEEVNHAVNYGLSHLTHFGNAMSGLHHREIGAVGAGFLLDQLHCEVIADGIHLSEDMLRLIYKKIGPERIILITDSMRAKGLPDGSYTLAGQDVKVVGSKATLADGTLAGSVLKMDEAVRMMWSVAADLPDLIRMSSSNAANRLGVFDRKGSIEVGKDADLVLLDADFEVRTTICRGKVSYSRE
ncbi:N-acetylglucosamine-6-phosphate deacetylase [Sporosarcina luteola]|uniref:N-acetylglucosamine-6-phosphate deacetylase n=1 Tax=Sporosarcina luteola TaxID=582850 RepID=UPI00203AAC59|nr:N-acetylglucosamine-6-phosphate deacetylase [Sporosarcina luteola]MCM3708977.1 N-acetylglucosamine-6-phosphate deacetylase [Sporosarcina luteola]